MNRTDDTAPPRHRPFPRQIARRVARQSAPPATTALLLALSLAACRGAATPPQEPRLEGSVTVFPVLLAGQPVQEVADVVGILLERAGSPQTELDETAFTPDASAAPDDQARAFGAFARQRQLHTDFALLAQILGSPQAGITEVRGALVDVQGNVLWSDRQRAGDAAFDRAHPHEPMDCCQFLLARLGDRLRLGDPARAGAEDGPLAARLKQRSGVPSPAELDAMRRRQDALAGRTADLKIRVFPAKVGDQWSAEAAAELAQAIEQRGLAHATAEGQPLPFATTRSMNEQRILWSGAASLQQAARKLDAGDAYLLCADFLMLGDGNAGAVHTYLLAPNGDLVFADYQNSHHDDFARQPLASATACARFSALRLAHLLGK